MKVSINNLQIATAKSSIYDEGFNQAGVMSEFYITYEIQ